MGLPSGDEILRQAARHGVERMTIRNRMVEYLRRSLGAIPTQLLVDLSNLVTDSYLQGRSHANEDIRLRMDLPLGTESILIRWPGDECPKEQPHAHVRFAAMDDQAPDVRALDERN